MILSPVSRLFFAIDLPAATKKAIGHYINTLKRGSKTHAIRWTRTDHLHITLQFLAEVQRDDVPMLLEKVKQKIKHFPAGSMASLGSVHLFPNPYRPRVIVLDIASQATLTQLSTLIGEGVSECGYEIDSRPFRAHITLGRIKHADMRLDFINKTEKPSLEDVLIEEVVLFYSEPQPEGSQYTPIEHIKLALTSMPTA